MWVKEERRGEFFFSRFVVVRRLQLSLLSLSLSLSLSLFLHLKLSQVLRPPAVARPRERVDVREPVQHLDPVVAVGGVVVAQRVHLHAERVVGREVERRAERPVRAAAALLPLEQRDGELVCIVSHAAALWGGGRRKGLVSGWRGRRGGVGRGPREELWFF